MSKNNSSSTYQYGEQDMQTSITPGEEQQMNDSQFVIPEQAVVAQASDYTKEEQIMTLQRVINEIKHFGTTKEDSKKIAKDSVESVLKELENVKKSLLAEFQEHKRVAHDIQKRNEEQHEMLLDEVWSLTRMMKELKEEKQKGDMTVQRLLDENRSIKEDNIKLSLELQALKLATDSYKKELMKRIEDLEEQQSEDLKALQDRVSDMEQERRFLSLGRSKTKRVSDQELTQITSETIEKENLQVAKPGSESLREAAISPTPPESKSVSKLNKFKNKIMQSHS